VSFIERFREYRHRATYEKPVKKSERAPIARKLMDVIKVCLDSTPEYLRALNHRQTQSGDDPTTASIPTEFDTDYGHFSVRHIDYPHGNGTTSEGYILTFEANAEGNAEERNRVELKVAVESNTQALTTVHGHSYYGPLPYEVGNFALALSPLKSEADKLNPNSPHTRAVIEQTVRKLLPTCDQNRKIGVSER